MMMPGRKFSAGTAYRYGFNGKENDKDISEGGQDYGMRIYDGRLGKFLSVDPLFPQYPWYTPYQFAGNKPIWAIDLDGLKERILSSGLLTNENAKKIFQLFDASDGGKEFDIILKGQSDFDVLFTTFNPVYSFNADGSQGSNSEAGAETLGIFGNIEELTDKENIKKWPYLENVKADDVKNTFDAHKKIIIVFVNSAFLDPEKHLQHPNAGIPNKKLFNRKSRIEGASAVAHESLLHVKFKILPPHIKNGKLEHQEDFGDLSDYTPTIDEGEHDPRYKDTNFYRRVQDLKAKDKSLNPNDYKNDTLKAKPKKAKP